MLEIGHLTGALLNFRGKTEVDYQCWVEDNRLYMQDSGIFTLHFVIGALFITKNGLGDEVSGRGKAVLEMP